MRSSKLTAEERAELVALHRDGRIEEMKALAALLGVSMYYGTILERRQRLPYERSRKRRGEYRAKQAGAILA